MTDDLYDRLLQAKYITEKNQTELPKAASLLIITIVYHTIVN